jgi:hypothetical protein
VVTYQADSPSRMCDGKLDEAARMLDRACVCLWDCRGHAYVYTCLSSIHTHVCVHTSTPLPGLVWRTVLRPHTSASSVLPSPLPTRIPLHHLTASHIPHIPSLSCCMYSASAVSSLKRQAWGIRHALCSLPAPYTECIYLSLTAPASMQTQAAGHRRNKRRLVIGMSHCGPQCAHTDDTAAPSSSGHSISTRH